LGTVIAMMLPYQSFGLAWAMLIVWIYMGCR
jgi:p-aminobenzoyl-glutamate transporter AbgT